MPPSLSWECIILCYSQKVSVMRDSREDCSSSKHLHFGKTSVGVGKNGHGPAAHLHRAWSMTSCLATCTYKDGICKQPTCFSGLQAVHVLSYCSCLQGLSCYGNFTPIYHVVQFHMLVPGFLHTDGTTLSKRFDSSGGCAFACVTIIVGPVKMACGFFHH